MYNKGQTRVNFYIFALMKFTASQIAQILEGTVEGNPEAEVSKLAKIEEGTPESLSFLSNPKYTHYIYTTEATITIVANDFTPEQEITTTLIKVSDPREAFSKLLEYYDMVKKNKSGIEQPSFISESATIGENIYLGAFSYISNGVIIGNNVKIYPNSFIGDNVVIGDDVVIFAGAKINSDSIIGDRCVIHSGAIVGSDGFGFIPNKKGVYKKVPQIGNVIIEEDVDVGAGTSIDRATLGSTVIKTGVKLDNQIQIAHNVEIGAHTAIAAQAGIAGSTKIGKHCLIGGQVGIAGHIVIGDNVKIQAQSGVGRNIKDGEVIQGTPSFGYTDWNKSYVHFRNLPRIVDRINTLEKNK